MYTPLKSLKQFCKTIKSKSINKISFSVVHSLRGPKLKKEQS